MRHPTCRSFALAIDHSLLLRGLATRTLWAHSFEHLANPGRASSRLYGDSHPLLRRGSAASEPVGWYAAYPLRRPCKDLCGGDTRVGVFVAKIQSGCQHGRCSVTVIHGLILLPF